MHKQNFLANLEKNNDIFDRFGLSAVAKHNQVDQLNILTNKIVSLKKLCVDTIKQMVNLAKAKILCLVA